MKAPTYIWSHQLEKMGYKEVPVEDFCPSFLDKEDYVRKFLSPSVKYAICGWDRVEYRVYTNENDEFGWYTEYAVLCPTKENEGRCYDVTGLSLGGIAEMIWMGVYN